MLAAVIEGPGAVGACRECLRGLPNLCARGGLLGRDVDGCFAEYVAVPESLLHPLPEGIPLGEVARALAASERPEHLKIVLDVAGR